jgi:hypothetical protein
MTWKQEKLLAQIDTVRRFGNTVVVSGGLAWHMMSPPHIEDKRHHDHSDVDLFIIPSKAREFFHILCGTGFNRYYTKYNTPNFYRYGKTIQWDKKRVKVLLDLFIEEIPFIRIGNFQVVDPKHLLPLYETTHSSKKCTAVVNATELIRKGLNPINRPELVGLKPNKWELLQFQRESKMFVHE